MNTEILGVVAQVALMVILAYPLGRYIAKVYKGEKTWSDFMAPIERVIYKVCGIDPKEEMNWELRRITVRWKVRKFVWVPELQHFGAL